MNHMKVSSLPIDPFKGVDFKEWEKVLDQNRPNIVYLTSSFQNPTGYSYSTTDLQKIIELSNQYGFGIIEDDWGSDMLSFSGFRPPLRSLGGENVLYMNSFTKKLIPSLRIGYLLGNKSSMKSLIRAKWSSTLGNPTLIEVGLFEFLNRGHYDGHLKKLHLETDARYTSCIMSLAEFMPSGVKWTTPGGGPSLWLELPRSVDLDILCERMKERGIHINLCNESFFGKRHLHGFVIGFSFLPADIMTNCLKILGNCIQEQL
jgi:2-aminoadipate transaminase